jgi:thiosulfate/3-mercaptopyruvate sulfurtransferase
MLGRQSPQQQQRQQRRGYLITPKQLHDALARNNAPDSTKPQQRTLPLCAAWFMPDDAQQRTGWREFVQQRVPGARFFDLDAVKDAASPYPHMLPPPAVFAQAMRALGVRRDDAVVVYDSAALGLFSAPRVAWTLRVFGHERVHVLNNFRLWVEQGYPVESGEPARDAVEPSDYPVPALDSRRVVAFDEVKRIAQDHLGAGSDVQILDARSAGRWSGAAPEPRPGTVASSVRRSLLLSFDLFGDRPQLTVSGLSSGHIPGSIGLPFTDLLDPDTKTLLPKEKIRETLKQHNVDLSKPIISSCGTGVTAAVIDAALEVAEVETPGIRRIYDGSWTYVLFSLHWYKGA